MAQQGNVSWRINGLGEADLGALLRGTLWRPPVTARRPLVEIPGRHGVISGQRPTFDAPTLPLVVEHRYKSADLIEAAVNRLVRLLAQPALTLSRVITTPGGVETVTSAPADLVAVDWGDFRAWSSGTATIMLSIPGVFLRGPVTASTAANLGTSTTLTLANLAGSTAPIGDAIIRIKGGLTNPSVTDANSGSGISWSGTLATTDYLYLDARTLTARRSTSATAWTSGGTDVTSTLSYPVGGPLQLWPDVNGAVTVQVTGSAPSASPIPTISVQAGGAYL